MMTTTYTAIRIDHENYAEEWWAALQEAYPAFASSLASNGVAVIAEGLWTKLAALPGFENGPEFAPNPILDCGSEGDQWADAVAHRHAVFDTLD